jgi:sigma-B regulation protein RsbU (phosphoserine phosphatase)
MTSGAMVIDVSQDWAIACDVQQRFMQSPTAGIDNLEYCARCRQLLALGGDCYDFMPFEDNRVAVTVADASGKGLAAALMIANVQSSIRTAALLKGHGEAATIRAVNRQVHASSLASRYATVFYAVFNGATRRLNYVNAGHNPPMVIRRGGAISWLETGGAPVGIFPDWSYQEGLVELAPGDLVIAYTDGVIEAVNPAGEEWGLAGFRKIVAARAAQPADEIVRAVFAAMDEFSAGRQMDDATVVVLKVH